jgi:CheY-like chemotaxis protein
MEGMARVLIVEDDVDVRDAMAQVLEVEGHEVRCAANGCAGLIEARLQRPDVILLDLMMPVMDGWRFRTEQKLDPSIATIPVVVVSALGVRSDIDATAFLPKPCALCDLLAVIDSHRPAA